jgi:hypothetical protein
LCTRIARNDPRRTAHHRREDPAARVGHRRQQNEPEGDREEGEAAGEVEEALGAQDHRRDEREDLDRVRRGDSEHEQGDAAERRTALAAGDGDERSDGERDDDRDERRAR